MAGLPPVDRVHPNPLAEVKLAKAKPADAKLAEARPTDKMKPAALFKMQNTLGVFGGRLRICVVAYAVGGFSFCCGPH